MIDTWAARWNIPAQAVAELAQLFTVPGNEGSSDAGENVVQQNLRVVASNMGFSLWRNNSGAMQNERGQHVRFGLGNLSARLSKVWKSSDLIGIGPGGRFVAVECKAPGWTGPKNDRELAQTRFLQTVESLGGIGLFATSISDYMNRVKP